MQRKKNYLLHQRITWKVRKKCFVDYDRPTENTVIIVSNFYSSEYNVCDVTISARLLRVGGSWGGS